jgi:hypothetical protein
LKLRRLDEAFIFNETIDRATYDEQRDRLREELTLAELELSDARIEKFDSQFSFGARAASSASSTVRPGTISSGDMNALTI